MYVFLLAVVLYVAGVLLALPVLMDKVERGSFLYAVCYNGAWVLLVLFGVALSWAFAELLVWLGGLR